MARTAERLPKFLARIGKELVRKELDSAAVGGMTKLGAELEGLLRACHREAVAGAAPRAATLLRPPQGPGEWINALSRLPTSSRGSALVLEIIRDARDPNGRMRRLSRVRNVVAHQADIPTPPQTKVLLAEVAAWLERYRLP